MISVNPGTIADLTTSLVTRFKDGLKRGPTYYDKIAQVETSTTAQSIYAWSGATGSLREWLGDRAVEEMKLYDWAIKNRHFEKTLRVNLDNVADNNLVGYGNEAEQLGDAANRHPDKLVTTLLSNGFTNLGYDGVAFFSTAHPGTGANQSNKGTTALSAAAYGAARVQMMGLTDDGGEILDINPDLLIVPPALEETAKQILNSDYYPTVAGTAIQQNTSWKGTANVLVLPRLSDSNDWFLLDSSKVLKPLIMQFRQKPRLTSLTAPNDDVVFRRNEALYGVDYRGEAGYSLWQLAFGASV